MKTDLLRDKFLDFFKSKKHKIIASDSLVPADDPTVLFTPAGMNQFKKEFLGIGRGLKRAATSQRCLRTDDLDKVGKTPGHHTFFEMLGNFSFGDYFKEETISWAWEFLTRVLKMDKKRIWISIYKDDDEAYEIWKSKINILSDKILRLGDKENFWPSEAKTKGPNGPCGPCSEIFFDLGPEVGCRRADCSPVCSCGRFVEVWNLVFTQFNRKEGGILEPLPRKNIDTGMGLERLAAVMQGVYSNFQTDLFKPIIKEIKTGIKKSKLINNELIYAVADHIRAITFAIFDGVLPSNEERGYIVRKLIRRSLMNLSNMGINRPFLYRLVPVVAQAMRRPYPQLINQREDISGVILAEEESFLSILKSAPDLLARAFEDRRKDSGQVAFQLYDTYGVPVEVTSEWLSRQGIKFNQSEFNRLLDLQKERSKASSSMKGEVFSLNRLPVKAKKTRFLGYRRCEFNAKIIAILKGDSETKKIGPGEEAEIILDATVFYPESGGQVADTGQIKKGRSVFEVSDAKRIDGITLHLGKLKTGNLKKNDAVRVLVDSQRRLDIARNHTATHILQAVLRNVLGEHVKQQGSLVAPERLRFDFTHFKDVSSSELNRIEELVNQHIWNGDKVSANVMKIERARKLGALAFFEEKYQKNVRVISIGSYSRELCGGTHLTSTAQVGLFKIISEGSVSSGVRRIEATTGKYAYAKIREQQNILGSASELLKVPQQEITRKLEKMLKEIKDLKKRKAEIKTEQINVEEILNASEEISGVKLITRFIPEADDVSLRSLVDLIKKRLPLSICLLATRKEQKAVLVMGVTADLKERDFNAGDLIKETARAMGGSGGGRADFAFGAGDIDKIEFGFNKLREIIKNLVVSGQ